MVTIASTIRSGTQSIFFFLYIGMIFGGSNRMVVRPLSRNRTNKASDSHDRHWRKHSQDPIPQDYQSAHSDAMQLYSIGAGQLVMVQKSGQVWDHDYELSAISANGERNGRKRNEERNGGKRNGGKRNKFVTETISYGKLKIRSEENKMYICAKSSGQIVFKNKAEKQSGKKKRPRRRCLFTWSFTQEKHIQLSLSSGGKDWYLAVQDGIVRLQPKARSTEKERSFIWLPTRSAHIRPMKRNHRYFPKARGFSLGVKPGIEDERECDSLQKQVDEKSTIIESISNDNERLIEENKRLRAELEKKGLKEPTDSNTTELIIPTSRKRLLTNLLSVGDSR